MSRKDVPDNIVQHAIELANMSSMKFKVSAVVYRDDKVLGSDYNRWFGSSKVCLYGVPVYSRHAEIGALRRAYLHYGYEGVSGASMYVHRVGRDGDARLAKPCEHCASVAELLGISNVYWSE